MRKEIKIDLEYRETSQSEFVTFNIDFVPYKVTKLFGEYQSAVEEMNKLWDESQTLAVDIEDLKLKKSENYKEEIEKKYARIEEIRDKIVTDYQHLPEMSYDMIKLILKKNNVKDEKFFNNDFWESSVDPRDLNDILAKVYLKDIVEDTNKKKAQALGY